MLGWIRMDFVFLIALQICQINRFLRFWLFLEICQICMANVKNWHVYKRACRLFWKVFHKKHEWYLGLSKHKTFFYNIRHMIYRYYYEFVYSSGIDIYPIDTNLFPIDYSLFPIGYSLMPVVSQCSKALDPSAMEPALGADGSSCRSSCRRALRKGGRGPQGTIAMAIQLPNSN